MEQIILKKAQIILGIGIFLILIAPYFFTRVGYVIFDESTGPIGDTIGGITSPIASLIGSVLVFYALKAQIDANKVIQQQISRQKREDGKRQVLQYINQQIEIIRKDIGSFSITDKVSQGFEEPDKYIVKTGLAAISKYVEELQYFGERDHGEPIYESNPTLAQFYYLLELISQLAFKINKEKINKRDRKFYLAVLRYEYKTKIRAVFKANEEYRMSNIEPCGKCGKRHTGILMRFLKLLIRLIKI